MEDRTIPYIAHEGEVARLERIIKKFFILTLVLIVLLVGSNIGWIIYEAQFVDEEYSVEAVTDQGGYAFANAGGDFNYGAGASDGQTEDAQNGR